MWQRSNPQSLALEFNALTTPSVLLSPEILIWLLCLALLDSFDTIVVAQASVHPSVWLLLSFLGNCLGDSCQIWKKAADPSYFKTFFFWFFQFLIFRFYGCFFLFCFHEHGTLWEQNCQMLFLTQIASKHFETCPKVFSQSSSENCFSTFWNFAKLNHNVGKISKHYSYKLLPNYFKPSWFYVSVAFTIMYLDALSFACFYETSNI